MKMLMLSLEELVDLKESLKQSGITVRVISRTAKTWQGWRWVAMAEDGGKSYYLIVKSA